MSLKLDGKKLSLEIEERLTDYISFNKIIAKRPPGLAVIRIGEDPASGVYAVSYTHLTLPTNREV